MSREIEKGRLLMKLNLMLALLVWFTGSTALASEDLLAIQRGRYMVQVTGCNDCHTPMYGPKDGAVPEKDWLIGVAVGWKGPWGTTYASNLRKIAASMTEEQWKVYMKNLKTRPPMPFYSVNAMTDEDIRAVYKFIRFLGDHENPIPAALPPGETPKTPYFNFDVVLPKSMRAAKGA